MLKKSYIFMIGILLVLAFAAGFCSVRFFSLAKDQPPAQEKQDTLFYHAQFLKPEDKEITQEYIGYVVPVHEVQIKPDISGLIEKINVKGGQSVKKGDVLLMLKQDEYIASLQSAEADILKAKANLTNALNYFNRLKKAGKSISPTELENAETAYLQSAASYEQAKAAYAIAKVNYDYTFITAPIDGVVGDVALTRGNYISPAGDGLLSIVQYNPIRVVFSISDKEYLHELEKKAPFDDEKLFLSLPNGKIFENEGIYRYMDNHINKSTTSIAVFADFINDGKVLTPNTYVTVLSKNTLKNIVPVQKNLVTFEDDGNFIYLIRDKKLVRQKVDILTTLGETFVLKNDFKAGDAVVTDSVNVQDIGKTADIINNNQKA